MLGSLKNSSAMRSPQTPTLTAQSNHGYSSVAAHSTFPTSTQSGSNPCPSSSSSTPPYVALEPCLLASSQAIPDQKLSLRLGPEKQQSLMVYFGKPDYQPVSASIWLSHHPQKRKRRGNWALLPA